MPICPVVDHNGLRSLYCLMAKPTISSDVTNAANTTAATFPYRKGLEKAFVASSIAMGTAVM